jgi:hypothetical protein
MSQKLCIFFPSLGKPSIRFHSFCGLRLYNMSPVFESYLSIIPLSCNLRRTLLDHDIGMSSTKTCELSYCIVVYYVPIFTSYSCITWNIVFEFLYRFFHIGIHSIDGVFNVIWLPKCHSFRLSCLHKYVFLLGFALGLSLS